MIWENIMVYGLHMGQPVAKPGWVYKGSWVRLDSKSPNLRLEAVQKRFLNNYYIALFELQKWRSKYWSSSSPTSRTFMVYHQPLPSELTTDVLRRRYYWMVCKVVMQSHSDYHIGFCVVQVTPFTIEITRQGAFRTATEVGADFLNVEVMYIWCPVVKNTHLAVVIKHE